MLDDLTKTFFETFEIEPKYKDYRTKNGKEYECKNPNNRNIRLCYPQITDRILLELICIVYKAKNSLNSEIDIFELNVNELKKTVLTRLIWINNTYKNEKHKHQVQELFKGKR